MSSSKYYIYHVINIKIGCTNNVTRRLSEQGYLNHDYEILEEYDDINIASVREKELQIQYGYRIDGPDYASLAKSRKISIENGAVSRLGKKQGKINAENGHLSRIGKIGGKKVGTMFKESGRWHQMAINAGKKSSGIEYECIECKKIIKGPSAFKHSKAFSHTIVRL